MARAARKLVTRELPAIEPAVPELPATREDTPSLDPAAIQRAYLRERARRNRRIEHREYARSSNARFWVMMAVLALITVVIALAALREIQTNFGVLQ